MNTVLIDDNGRLCDKWTAVTFGRARNYDGRCCSRIPLAAGGSLGLDDILLMDPRRPDRRGRSPPTAPSPAIPPTPEGRGKPRPTPLRLSMRGRAGSSIAVKWMTTPNDPLCRNLGKDGRGYGGIRLYDQRPGPAGRAPTKAG